MLGYVRRMLSVISAGLKEKVPYECFWLPYIASRATNDNNKTLFLPFLIYVCDSINVIDFRLHGVTKQRRLDLIVYGFAMDGAVLLQNRKFLLIFWILISKYSSRSN